MVEEVFEAGVVEPAEGEGPDEVAEAARVRVDGVAEGGPEDFEGVGAVDDGDGEGELGEVAGRVGGAVVADGAVTAGGADAEGAVEDHGRPARRPQWASGFGDAGEEIA